MAEDEPVDCIVLEKAIEACHTAQAMIDINAEHLDGLRTQCTTSAELTKHEIRTLENKLLRLFCRQLAAKRKCGKKNQVKELSDYPKLRQWLHIVGVNKNLTEGICLKVKTMEFLLQLTDVELRKVLREHLVNEVEVGRMLRAQKKIQTYTELQKLDDNAHLVDLDLHWESWDQNPTESSPNNGGYLSSRSDGLSEPDLSYSQESSGQSDFVYPQLPVTAATTSLTTSTTTTTAIITNSVNTCTSTAITTSTTTISSNSTVYHLTNSQVVNSTATLVMPPLPPVDRYTPPPTPGNTGTGKSKGDRKFPTTPPPSKKHQTLLPEAFPLTKSKSHEEHLSNRVEPVDPNLISSENLPRRRLATEPGLESSGTLNYNPMSISSPSRSPPFISPEQPFSDSCFSDDVAPPSVPVLPAPRSPRTRGMVHMISHRFVPTFKVTTCQFCEKAMILGFKCKECKFRCHRDCMEKVPPSCGLPSELVDVFVQTVREEEGKCERELKKFSGAGLHGSSILNMGAFPMPDSSSNTSSCNSSSPSSPALIITSVNQTTPISTLAQQQHFKFPEVKTNSSREETTSTKESEMVETQKSNDSDKTASGASGSGSTDSEKTLAGRVDSQDSQVSDVDPSEKGWPRQNSAVLYQLSMREWDIPYDELVILEKIGTGRFGTVCKGNWHGMVAVKMLNMDQLDDQRTLETFKQEVATFRKTRHENLVLFMGACMKPPHLAIVTSLCKGNTLYTHIHLLKDKFNLNRSISIARQISQGMGYLHAREIIHKDLKTKNIFYENGTVVITDFGLFSFTKLCQKSREGEWLTIPKGWLCYLAPEVIRSLRAENQMEGDFPFTTASDIYAFGTVWYELLCGEWPFQGLPPEAVIWQVGKGIRQSLANIQSSKDVKDLIMMCWSYKARDRPDFAKMLTMLSQLPLLPRKRLARSPSHPVHLSRSAESVF